MTQKKSIKERIEAIKREEREDASAYYEQGEAAEYSAEEVNPTKPIDKEQEAIGLLKTIIMVALGVAGLALILNFYFIADLETRVSGMNVSISKTGETIETAVAKLDKDLKTLDEKIDSILKNLEDISALSLSGQNKEALAEEQDEEATEESEEGDEEASAEEQDEEATEESEEGDEEASAEEQDEETTEESEEGDEEASAEEQDEEAAEESEEGDEEASVEEQDEEGNEEHAATEVESDVIPALAPADDSSSASHAGEIPLSASALQEVDEIEEELPSVEELN